MIRLNAKQGLAALSALALLGLGTPAGAEDRAPLPGAPEPLVAATPNPAQPAWPVQLSGNFWVDTGYLNRENTQPGEPNQQTHYMTGRFVLGGTYARSVGELTAKAKVELLGLVNEFANASYGEPHVQDVYVQVGQGIWDVQLGRFLGQEVYYRGQGIELYTAEEAGAKGAPKLYLVDFNRGHENGPGQVAVHLRPTDTLSLEVAGVYGFDNEQNNLGVRPVVDLHLGSFQVVGGYEYRKISPTRTGNLAETTQQGYGARVQYRMPIFTAGLDFSQASIDVTGLNGDVDAGQTIDKTSLGGWVDADLGKHSLGVGYHLTTQENVKAENNKHHQAFASYLYRLPIEGLSVKAVYGYALGQLEDADANTSYENALNSFRVRVAYDFK